MGSTSFKEVASGADPQAAFSAARDDARHMHGWGGYSGSLAEKDDFEVITYKPLMLNEAFALADRLMVDCDPRIDDKWGPAGMIPLLNTGVDDLVTCTISVNTTEPKYVDAHAAAFAAAEAKMKPGETVLRIQQQSATGTVRSKIVVEATRGEIVKGYVIVNQGQEGSTLFERLSQARAAATKKARRHGDHGSASKWQVRGILARRQPNGELTRDLVVAESVPTRVERTFEATIAKMVTGTATVGWLIFGWASS